MSHWMIDVINIAIAVLLVVVNGFFVATEFALVKVRPSRINILVRENRPHATTLRWLVLRLDASLSACQLGITMASLGLGWIGEPAVARFLDPLAHVIGITSPKIVHAVSFVIAFSLITSLHLVLGEQAPKIFAIRRPELLALRCAQPLRAFYFASWPFLMALNKASTVLLKPFGIIPGHDQEAHHTEEEIRVLLEQSLLHGELSRTEHRLLNAVFEFDDLLSRQVMVPRQDVVIWDLDLPIADNMKRVTATKHTRYPVCDASLDDLRGVFHIKDLVELPPTPDFDVTAIMRHPIRIPAAMPISKLLRQFQSARQHMAFVVDEYGTIIGMVTLENVLEQIVGRVEDEFDLETPDIIPIGENKFMALGSASLNEVQHRLRLDLSGSNADTLSGFLVERIGRIPRVGDTVKWDRGRAEVLEVKGSRAERIEITMAES